MHTTQDSNWQKLLVPCCTQMMNYSSVILFYKLNFLNSSMIWTLTQFPFLLVTWKQYFLTAIYDWLRNVYSGNNNTRFFMKSPEISATATWRHPTNGIRSNESFDREISNLKSWEKTILKDILTYLLMYYYTLIEPQFHSLHR